MNVLVAFEFSGIVRDAFAARGHNAWSLDLLPSERGGQHMQCDARNEINNTSWDLLIAHPPCTYLANSGNKHLYEGMKKESGPNHKRWSDMIDAAHFFYQILQSPIKKLCVENPIMHGYAQTYIQQKPSQIIQPWQFGHGEIKATCLWLRDLPKLKHTCLVEGRRARVHREPPSENRWKERSRTLQGIADAMADQWGGA